MKNFKLSLTMQIIIATIAGILFGTLVGEWAGNLKFIGDIFIRLIQMSVVLLVMTSVIGAIGEMSRNQEVEPVDEIFRRSDVFKYCEAIKYCHLKHYSNSDENRSTWYLCFVSGCCRYNWIKSYCSNDSIFRHFIGRGSSLYDLYGLCN